MMALVAMLAGVDHATNRDSVADSEAGYLGADIGYSADDLVPWYNGIDTAAPVVTGLVEVRVAHATVKDFDGDVVVAQGTSFEGKGLESRASMLGGVSNCFHLSILMLEKSWEGVSDVYLPFVGSWTLRSQAGQLYDATSLPGLNETR